MVQDKNIHSNFDSRSLLSNIFGLEKIIRQEDFDHPDLTHESTTLRLFFYDEYYYQSDFSGT